MSSTQSPLKWRVLIGGVAGLVGVGAIVAALAFPAVTAPQAQPTSTATSAAHTTRSSPATPTTTTATPSTAPTPTVRELQESAPTRVRIASIGVDAGTVPLGLDGNELETPADPDVVGWFTGAHTPGAPGRAVLAGHLTWNGRHTVFARLPDLVAGALVEVEREDGTTARFEITKVSTFAKDAFPTAEVYAATDEPSLVLITCGGEYDPSQNYYDSNVIAFARALTG